MSTLLLLRSPPCLPFLYPPWSSNFLRLFRRHESSARRTTKKLRNKPDASFSAFTPDEQLDNHIVFNPPSSSPSPYQTPPAFLPSHDPRRALLSQSYQHANPYKNVATRLPPLTHKVRSEKKHHLTPKEIEEIRLLRSQDPYKWTRKVLAEKYGCSQFFVGMIAEASADKKQKENEVQQAYKDKWGTKRAAAREDRQRRRELWAMDR